MFSLSFAFNTFVKLWRWHLSRDGPWFPRTSGGAAGVGVHLEVACVCKSLVIKHNFEAAALGAAADGSARRSFGATCSSVRVFATATRVLSTHQHTHIRVMMASSIIRINRSSVCKGNQLESVRCHDMNKNREYHHQRPQHGTWKT